MRNAADLPVPRWLHYWAILTVAAAVVAIPLGALVTTIRAGMADPVWPTEPWFLAKTPWEGLSVGFLIEHSHRLAAYIVGFLAIILAVGSWVRSPRWLNWLGTAALVAVSLQGILGGYRVRLNALLGPEMAAVHGVFGALVFSLLVSVAVLTRRPKGEALAEDEQRRFGRLSWHVALVVLVQLAFGALLRHTYLSYGPRLHLLGAFAVLAMVMWLTRAVWESPGARKRLGWSVSVLILFVAIQLVLGVEAWLSKFAQGMFPELQAAPSLPQVAVRTAHFLIGSCILASSVATFLLARWSPSPVPTAEFSPPLSSPRPRGAVTTAPARLEGTA